MITTLYTITVPIYEALTNHEYELAETHRQTTISFINNVFGSFVMRWKLKRMYIFKAMYNESVDIAKVRHDVQYIKDHYSIDALLAKSKSAETTISRRYTGELDTNSNKDNSTYLYDVSGVV